VHLVGIAQSFAMFVVVCLVTAALLSAAMAGLARMERAAVPVPVNPDRRRSESRPAIPSPLRADRVSSPGSVTFGPRR
jgi:hypothetical protein